MQVDQITYGSIKRSRMKGYQIIGRSAGIDSNLASSFCQWAPSHNSLEVADERDRQNAWAFSFFPLSDQHFAIARTVHGSPEYSGRGGLTVNTSSLILTRKQLAQFGFDAVAVARTALTLGHLILSASTDETLPEATLPGQTIRFPAPQSDFTDSTPPILPNHAVHWIARETCSLILDHRRVMIVGECDPLPILYLIYEQLTAEQRSDIYFACGLRLTNRRDFRVQFTSQQMSPRLQNELDRLGMASIDLSRVLLETK